MSGHRRHRIVRFLWLLRGRGQLDPGDRLRRDLVYLAMLALGLGALWGALLARAPTLLVATTNGLQTLFQVMAAALVAVVVLLLGSIFLIAQHASTTFGDGAVRALLLRPRVRLMVATALLLCLVALLVSGQVPDDSEGCPDEWITAAASALTLASAAFIFASAMALAGLNEEATSWEKFAKRLVADARKCPGGPAAYHMSIACESLVKAARAQDGEGMRWSLHAATRIVGQHAARHEPQPVLWREPGPPAFVPMWVNRLSWALLNAGEVSLSGGALWRDADRIGRAFMEVINKLRAARMVDEATVFVDALAQLAAVGQQLDEQSPLRRRWLTRCTTALANVEAASESYWHRPIAEHALVGWALACSAVDGKHWRRGALFEQARSCLGAAPPLGRLDALLEAVVNLKEPVTKTWRWPTTTETERLALIKHARALLAALA